MPMMSKAEALTRLNTVQPSPVKVQLDSRETLIDVNQPEILDLIRQTHADLRLKQDAAARIAGVKPSQYSAALNGQGNFGATWIWAQDDLFVSHLLDLIKAARGLTEENVRVLRRRRIVELIDLLLAEAS